MVYGLYDVQGYDSLYTKAYKDSFSRVQGIDCSPPENGNMVLMRRVGNDSEMVSGVPGLGVSVVLSATDAPERYFSKQASLGDVSVYQARWRPTGMAYQYVLDPPDGMEYTEKLRSEWQGPNSLLIRPQPRAWGSDSTFQG